MEEMDKLVSLLSELRIPAVPGEYDLHALVAEKLRSHAVEFTHEARLAARCRVDFLCGTTGIEIKKNKPARAALLDQLRRYLEQDQLSGIIVLSPCDLRLPRAICGKRVEGLALGRLWGVALP